MRTREFIHHLLWTLGRQWMTTTGWMYPSRQMVDEAIDKLLGEIYAGMPTVTDGDLCLVSTGAGAADVYVRVGRV